LLPEVGAFLSALTPAPMFEDTDFPFRPLCAGPDLVLLLVLTVFCLAALTGAVIFERDGLLSVFELRTTPLPELVRVPLFVPEVSLGFTGLMVVAMLERAGLLTAVEVDREPLPRFARALTTFLLVVLLTLAAGFGFAGAAMLERVGLLLVIEVR
jgi:hypothetical protein